MKKLFVTILLIVPVVAFAAPSVKKLGMSSAVVKASSGTEVSSSEKGSATNVSGNVARVGTLRLNSKKPSAGGTVGAITSSGARFPVIATAKSYNGVTVVPSNNTPINTNTGVSVNKDEILSDILDAIQDDYYDKQDIDNKIQDINTELATVNDKLDNINNNFDDARFDAVRLVNPETVRDEAAPAGYVYMWISSDSDQN